MVSIQYSPGCTFALLQQGKSALDAVQAGCTVCEEEQCDYTVGYGGGPDENGETALDAMLMDGTTLNIGAVANLRRIKSAAAVARMVLDHASHSLIVGDLATEFAKKFGFVEEPLNTCQSIKQYQQWKENGCQPNFWTNPDPLTSCGPYRPIQVNNVGQLGQFNEKVKVKSRHHDTIGMIAIDKKGNLTGGTSTNGAKHKIPGRVGDSPLPGARCYVDGEVGGAAATGDGDVMLRLLPSFVAVEEMRRGALPQAAAESAIARISDRYPSFMGGIVVVRRDGKYGAACYGMKSFPYVVSSEELGTAVLNISCK